jgi:DNA-directed RNA polymerase subunit L
MFTNKNYNERSNSFSIEINQVDLAFVNAIRRIILTEIPVIGFRGEDEPSLEVISNNGPLHNEIILHRFGLIPIHFTADETENFDPDSYEFEIDINNKTDSRINVTSEHFIVKHKGVLLAKKEVQRLFPPSNITGDYILITRLQKGQFLNVKGKAVKLTAQVHSGFCPVSLSNFKYMSDLNEIVKHDNVLDKERAFMKNEYGEPTSFLFEIESVNALTPKYLISKAIEILNEKISFIFNNINDIEYRKTSNLESNNENEMVGYEFIFKDEDDTLGWFLQSQMFNHYIRSKTPTQKNKIMTYVGYTCPHPLDTTVVLKIYIKDSDSVQEYKDVLIEQSRRCLDYLQNIQSEWIRIMQK